MWPLLLLGILWLAPPPVRAQDALSLQVVRTAQQGTSLPRLSLLANQRLSLSLSLRCGSLDPLSAQQRLDVGQRLDLDIPLTAPGQVSCSGALTVQLADGDAGEMPLAFVVEVLPAMQITVSPGDLDLADQTLIARFDRDVSRVEVEAFGLEGSLGSTGVSGPFSAGEPVSLHWTPPDEILRLRITAQDTGGFWAGLELLPWSYAVPHEDVVFASGKAAIAAEQVPRLEDAMTEIRSIIAKYGAVAELNLYVAGYTDTVGAAASNRALSEARARAIAAWFRQAGFSGQIYYQGCGEAGLLVSTPDEVDEPRNRRAAYIVAAEAPPQSERLPGSAWTRL